MLVDVEIAEFFFFWAKRSLAREVLFNLSHAPSHNLWFGGGNVFI
jgi:hypothetical protein